jgi:hypothetical protein
MNARMRRTGKVGLALLVWGLCVVILFGVRSRVLGALHGQVCSSDAFVAQIPGNIAYVGVLPWIAFTMFAGFYVVSLAAAEPGGPKVDAWLFRRAGSICLGVVCVAGLVFDAMGLPAHVCLSDAGISYRISALQREHVYRWADVRSLEAFCLHGKYGDKASVFFDMGDGPGFSVTLPEYAANRGRIDGLLAGRDVPFGMGGISVGCGKATRARLSKEAVLF